MQVRFERLRSLFSCVQKKYKKSFSTGSPSLLLSLFLSPSLSVSLSIHLFIYISLSLSSVRLIANPLALLHEELYFPGLY